MDTSALLPDEYPVTLAWTRTTTTHYLHAFPLGELRAAVNDHGSRLGYPRTRGIAEGLRWLTGGWLRDYEYDPAGAGEVAWTITDTGLVMPQFTVTIESTHNGRAALVIYCLHAADLSDARALALAHCNEQQDLGIGRGGAPITPHARVLEDAWCTFPGPPPWPRDLPGRTWTDLRTDPDMLTRAARAITAP